MTQTRQDSAGSFKLPESRLYRATRAWVLFAQGLFAAAPPGQFKWSSDPNDSEIIITSVHPTEKRAQHKRPILVVGRTTATTVGLSRDQTLHYSKFGESKTFSRLYMFHMQITAVAREGVEAENLLWYVDEWVLPMKSQIQRIGRMHHIGTQTSFSSETTHGMIVPGSSVPEWRAVSLTIPCSLQSTVSADSTEQSFLNVLRSVNLQLETATS